jgi:CheY-like chemotaxis protein
VRDTGLVRVLVVDDDEAVRSALTHALHRDGYNVSTAGDGATALAALLRNRHDAVVLDVLMPEPGGLEVCRVIRARGDDTPILMLTARDLVSDRVAGLDAAPTTTWPSRSRSRNCGRGCAHCCGAAARAPACSGSPASSSMSQPTR